MVVVSIALLGLPVVLFGTALAAAPAWRGRTAGPGWTALSLAGAALSAMLPIGFLGVVESGWGGLEARTWFAALTGLSGAALSLVALAKQLSARRQAPGACASCGYDLRGLQTDSAGRCPECGRLTGPWTS